MEMFCSCCKENKELYEITKEEFDVIDYLNSQQFFSDHNFICKECLIFNCQIGYNGELIKPTPLLKQKLKYSIKFGNIIRNKNKKTKLKYFYDNKELYTKEFGEEWIGTFKLHKCFFNNGKWK